MTKTGTVDILALQNRVAELETQNAELSTALTSQASTPLRVKVGQTGALVIHGLHSKPQLAVTLYGSQLTRLLRGLPDVVRFVLAAKGISYRTPEEKATCETFLRSWLKAGE